MTAREFLDQYRTAYEKADRLKNRLDELREASERVGGSVILAKYENRISKPTERKAERVQEAFERWAAAQLDSVEIRQKIFEAISSLDDCKVADVLWYRYLGLFTWEEVCDAVGLSWCSVHKRHREGLELIEKLIN